MRCFAFNQRPDGSHVGCDHTASVVFAGQHYCGWHAEEIRKAIGGSWVYFAARDGLIKIGQSHDVTKRMKGLGARLLTFEPGGVERERELHLRFFDHRVRGEWFRDAPEIRAYISELSEAA